MQSTHFIGIDVSKETLDYCLLSGNKVVEQGQVKNSITGVKGLVRMFKKNNTPLATTLWCLEHTGIYGNLVLSVLSKMGLPLWLENPIQIKLSQGMVREKNDKIDAYRIAVYASTHSHKALLYEPQREVIIQLQKLQSLRDVLIKSKGAIKKNVSEANRFLDKNTAKLMNQSIKQAVRGIDKDLMEVELKMKTLIHEDSTLKTLDKYIQSVDGVGLSTSVAILTTTNEFKRIQCPIKYNCYAGIAPFKQQSGKSLKSKSRVSHKANKKVKTILHMAALSSIQVKDSEFGKYYKRKTEEGKNGMTVINAIRSKIVARIFACVRDQRMYQKDYEYLKMQVA